MKIRLSERQFVYILLASLLVLFIILLVLSEGYYGGGDNLSHYKYSRYSYLHPEFLLYHWGKPVFTLITFPFAQFGFTGVQVFNILTGLVSAYLCYLVARKLNYQNSPLVIILVCFTPIYTIIMLSGMTEILFGLFCILTVYLILKEKYLLSSIIISFSPLVRTEGIYIIPVIGLALLIKKKYGAIPLLFTGFIVYSIIGYFYYNDIFWLIKKMPYRGATDLLGTGPLLHYINISHRYLGNGVRYLLVIGLVTFIVLLIRKSRETMDEAVLIILPFLVYFTAHSLMWWSGIGNSDGNYRYMAAIVPFTALICLKGFNIMISPKFISRIQWLKYSIILIIFVIIIIIPFDIYTIPVKMNRTQKLVNECSRWLESTEYINRKFYYYDPDFIYYLNFNPYDENISHHFLYRTEKPEYNIDIGSAVIWDAHYSPNQYIPLKKLAESPYFKLVKVFTPERKLIIFGRDYKICVFERITYDSRLDSIKVMESLPYLDLSGFKHMVFYNFDEKVNHSDSIYISNNISFSGKYSIKTDSTKTYLLAHSFKVSDIPLSKPAKIISSCKVLTNDASKQSILLVVTLEHKNRFYVYSAAEIDDAAFQQNDWNILQQITELPEPQSAEDILKVYFWNRGKSEFYIDDFYVGIKEH
jgi:hypothetical protein